MDAKALAKSKRAHSQHHSKKTHSSQKPKPPSAGANDAASAKRLTGKQIREETHQGQRGSALPLNWDRYKEDFYSGSEDPSGDSASQAPDIVVPKSKGADFRHLIAEAQSRLHSNPYSDSLSSLDDVLPGDFNQFLGSMLAVRGEGVLSWVGNDNFVVEDRLTATPEASFLSLNLHALAEQLEKVDLPERLFIEEDLLQPKQHAERSKVNSSQESEQMQMTSEGKAYATITEDLTLFAAKNVEHISLGSGSQAIDATLSNGGLDLVDEVYSDFISSQHGKSGESRAEDNSNSASVSDKRDSTFEAATAEAELDMLLNSFSESKLLDTSGLKSEKPSSDFHREGTPFLPQVARKGVDSSKSAAITSSFDDVLDNLLQETSTMVNQGVDSSKSAAVNSTVDDFLDDLLAETSTMVNQNRLSRHEDAKAVPDDNIQSSLSSQSASKSKVLNDFDSWLDTI
ncbi:uncharacterized protein LOC111309317 [Durio zibethinus]|uniref:Uncharacterized protein LOC111309317 n=1 Tax=Durio zibethinus TaxID=66656 RepID=A0A6P6AGX0_DURZI|nr:uncharacterized protein LOC111309317 [Durio zibethinus]